MQSTVNKILKRIRGKRRGWVFTPRDFLDLGGRAVVDQSLSRLARRGTIRRLRRGLYDYPRQNPLFGLLTPSSDVLADAVVRSTGHRLQVSGASAANTLGLSMQVPARPFYITDGPPRQVTVGQRVIRLRQARRFAGARKRSQAVLRALNYIGKDGVDDAVIRKLSSGLSQQDKAALLSDLRYASTWMQPVINRIAVGT